jgi:hypothetical protein
MAGRDPLENAADAFRPAHPLGDWRLAQYEPMGPMQWQFAS